MSILKNNSPIGFFDSGVGGLTVLNKVKTLMPNESFIFFGDTLHVPYGDKTKEQLLSYAYPILEFFKEKKCKAVVMACNTTSSLIYDEIKNKYPFKIYPVVQSVAKVLSGLEVKRLGVFATKGTIESGAYSREINKFNSKIQVFGQFCPDWVNIVESGQVNTDESIKIVYDDLNRMLDNNPEKIVLGCTHYPYLLPILSKFAPKNMFIDPSGFFAEYIMNDLKECNLISDNANFIEEFYVSTNPEQFKESAKLFYELDNEPTVIKF